MTFFSTSTSLSPSLYYRKTIQAAALLQHIETVYPSPNPFLIVVPLSTIGHWKRTLDNWTNLNTVHQSFIVASLFVSTLPNNFFQVTCAGSRADRDLCRLYEWRYWTESGEEVPELFKFDVLVCSAAFSHHYRF